VQIGVRNLQEITLVRMKTLPGNPEWQGDWSERSRLWTEDTRRAVGFDMKNSETFYISLEQFKQVYGKVTACRVNPNYRYSFTKCQAPSKKPRYYKFLINTPGEYYVTVSQPNHVWVTAAKPQYAWVNIIMAEMLMNETATRNRPEYDYSFIDGEMSVARDVSCRFLALNPGEYIAYVRLQWPDDQNEFEYGLSVYGTSKVSIEEIPTINNSEILKGIMLDHARKFSTTLKTYASMGFRDCLYTTELLTQLGLGYFFYSNKSKTNMTEEITLKASTGITFKKPVRGKKARIDVKAGEEAIILIRINPMVEKPMIDVSKTTTFEMAVNELIRLAKANGIVQNRQHKNKEVDIIVYVLHHQNGVCYYYENLTSNLVIAETLTLDTRGVGVRSDAVLVNSNAPQQPMVLNVLVQPRESKHVILDKINDDWAVKASVSYRIGERAREKKL
jgi:hypothetical protein